MSNKIKSTNLSGLGLYTITYFFSFTLICDLTNSWNLHLDNAALPGNAVILILQLYIFRVTLEGRLLEVIHYPECISSVCRPQTAQQQCVPVASLVSVCYQRRLSAAVHEEGHTHTPLNLNMLHELVCSAADGDLLHLLLFLYLQRR